MRFHPNNQSTWNVRKQVLTIVAWTINTAVIAAGGRLDANTVAVDTGKDAKEQLPEARYFLPAGWAFAIWGPIILGNLTPPNPTPPHKNTPRVRSISHSPIIRKRSTKIDVYNRTTTTTVSASKNCKYITTYYLGRHNLPPRDCQEEGDII